MFETEDFEELGLELCVVLVGGWDASVFFGRSSFGSRGVVLKSEVEGVADGEIGELKERDGEERLREN